MTEKKSYKEMSKGMFCLHCDEPMYAAPGGIWRDWEGKVKCPENKEKSHEPMKWDSNRD